MENNFQNLNTRSTPPLEHEVVGLSLEETLPFVQELIDGIKEQLANNEDITDRSKTTKDTRIEALSPDVIKDLGIEDEKTYFEKRIGKPHNEDIASYIIRLHDSIMYRAYAESIAKIYGMNIDEAIKARRNALEAAQQK